MNEYISEELRKKWVNYEFKGKPFKLSDGKNYMRAFSHCFGITHFYCFEDDWFWHDQRSIPVKTVEKEVSDVLT